MRNLFIFILCSMLLVCLLCVSWVTSCAAASYTITDAELTRLETVFRELKSTNEILMQDSTKSQQDLIKALKLLNESQAELKLLQNRLGQLQNESQEAKNSLKQASNELAKVNQSFEAYAKEQKKIQARLKTERTLWMIVAAGAFYLAASK